MLHANFDGSKQGSAFLSKNSLASTRALTIAFVRDNPNLDKDALFEEFRRTILATEDHQRDVDMYFFANAFADARKSQPQSYVQSAANLVARRESISAAAAQVVNQISLLFLTMPNGKAMRYCTGREMENFGKGYAKIAKRAGAKTVGEVLNEGEVKQLMAA